MPIIKEDQIMKIPGSAYQFSAIKPEHLEATLYTLVTIVIDVSGSILDFKDDLLKMLKEVIKACQHSPMSENLMVRFVTFNDHLKEMHGFKLLMDINADDYDEFDPKGGTALFDASFEAVGATATYSQVLSAPGNNFTVNGAIYIITDGEDNSSKFSASMVKMAVDKTKNAEVIESLITILIGLNTKLCGPALATFKADAGLTQYIDMGDVTSNKLAKLGGMISQSVSSQSKHLGSGGPSAPIELTI
jgi:hypothetical protein